MKNIPMRHLGLGAIAAVVVLSIAVMPVCADVPIYVSGHCDLGTFYDAGEGDLHLYYHFNEVGPGYDEEGNELAGQYESASLYTRVSDANKTTVPDNDAFDFVGAPDGSDLWILSQNEAPGIPFLGFGTQELNPTDWSTPITYQLIEVDGPGEFSMWTNDWFGNPSAYWATSDEVDSLDVYRLGALGHAHANWGFTAAGVYDVKIQISGTLAGETTPISSEVTTFTFLVGAPGPRIPGDANEDGKVDGSDVTILAGNWQKGVSDGLRANWAEGDFNDDGKVDGSDVTILAGNWQFGVGTSATAVPEPSSLILLVTGISLLTLRLYHKRYQQ